MIRIKIVIVILSFLVLSFINKDEYRIITQKGISPININESNLKDVKKAFPGGKVSKDVWGGKKVTASVRLTNGESIPIKMKPQKQIARTYTIKKEGISFYFNFKDTLSSITIWGKNMYKTDKGIIIGKSTFRELDSLYGTTSFGRIHTRLVKNHGNFIFFAGVGRVPNIHEKKTPIVLRIGVFRI